MMNNAFEKEVWDNYARAFIAVTPLKMLELNKAVASFAIGDVCDFGCGAAKIAPFIVDKPEVSSYTGIDYSIDMVTTARWHLEQFPAKPSAIIHGKIEDLSVKKSNEVGEGYDFGLSINSYYSWDAPDRVLQHIYDALKPKAQFVLVTPNPSINMESLLKEAKKELIANPYFESFREQNMSIAGNEKALFIEMDDLIGQVRRVGFKVIEAKQCFYDKGLNFLYLVK